MRCNEARPVPIDAWGNHYNISSPSYPRPYPPMRRCRYAFRVETPKFRIRCDVFAVAGNPLYHCRYGDYLEIRERGNRRYTKRLCGRRRRDGRFTIEYEDTRRIPVVFVTFVSNWYGSGRYFCRVDNGRDPIPQSTTPPPLVTAGPPEPETPLDTCEFETGSSES